MFGAGAVAVPVQAVGIATTDLDGLGSFGSGQWTVLVVLFVGMAAAYTVQAVIGYRVARGGARHPVPGRVPIGS